MPWLRSRIERSSGLKTWSIEWREGGREGKVCHRVLGPVTDEEAEFELAAMKAGKSTRRATVKRPVEAKKAVEDFLRHLRASGRRQGTIDHDRDKLKPLVDTWGHRPMAEWARPHLEALLTEREWAATRVRNAVGVYRRFICWCHAVGYECGDFVAGFKPPRARPAEDRGALTAEQARKLLDDEQVDRRAGEEAAPSVRAIGHEAAGWYRLMAGEDRAAYADFQAAVLADPSREGSWQAALYLAGKLRVPAAVQELAKRWLGLGDTAVRRYRVAKAWEAVGDLAQAESYVRDALRLDPSSVEGQLGLVALLARTPEDPDRWREAVEVLGRVRTTLMARWETEARADPLRTHILEWMVIEGVMRAFSGDIEGATTMANRVLAGDPEVESAAALLAALGGTAPAPNPSDPGGPR